jgi:hypothetical protein
MKKAGFLLFVLITALQAYSQRIAPPDIRFLRAKEDSLQIQTEKMAVGRELSERVSADSIFTRLLVRALKTKNSFYYPFDSLEGRGISKLYAPDSSFRIYTWQLNINENLTLQHGAIQMRTADGSLKIFPLIDKSDVTKNPSDSIGDNKGWMGAVYYKIIQKNYNGHNYYTLLGFDQNNIRSDKKLMDILEFVNGQPVFGNKLFVFQDANQYQKNMARFILEYKKEATPRLSYDAEMDAIVFDELISETNEPKKKFTMIPDGEYEGFKWTNGKWVYTTNLFGGTPVKKYSEPQTIRDANGNIDPTKLKGGETDPPSGPN